MLLDGHVQSTFIMKIFSVSFSEWRSQTVCLKAPAPAPGLESRVSTKAFGNRPTFILLWLLSVSPLYAANWIHLYWFPQTVSTFLGWDLMGFGRVLNTLHLKVGKLLPYHFNPLPAVPNLPYIMRRWNIQRGRQVRDARNRRTFFQILFPLCFSNAIY